MKQIQNLNVIYQHSACKFLIGAKKKEDFPNNNTLEFAFVGRSNVGKSTLINTLFNSQSIARTSKNPGCTQQINFFSINNEMFRIVDLPGYGYADASKQFIAEWQNLIWYYLNNRENLRQTFLLIDARRGIMVTDEEFIYAMNLSNLKFYVVISKIDKISKDQVKELTEKILEMRKRYRSMYNIITTVSSKKKIGIESLRGVIIQMLRK